MIWVIRNKCIFETVADTNMKQLENNKGTHQVFVINIDLTYQPRMALRSLPKENGVSSARGLDRTSATHFLAP
jgi:hypothetical protein